MNSGQTREESFEHVLMCLICRSLFDEQEHQPKFLPCHHTFCKDCLREYVRQFGDEIECPSCRKIATVPTAGVCALQTNYYIKYIQNLVRGGGPGGFPGMEATVCARHTELEEVVIHFCQNCCTSVCKLCLETSCAEHKIIPIDTAGKETFFRLAGRYEKCNTAIESKKTEVESVLKSMSLEKDDALKQIEATFQEHSQTLHRRATLLKNKVIDIYNDHAGKLDSDMDEISTALACIINLKEYQEELISKGQFNTVEQGLNDLDEVHNNIAQQINPRDTHIVFDKKHGMEKFKAVCKDLGRVTSRLPSVTPVAHGSAGERSSETAQSRAFEHDESPVAEEPGASA